MQEKLVINYARRMMLLLLCLGLEFSILITPSFAYQYEIVPINPSSVITGIMDENQLRSAVSSAFAGTVIEIGADITISQGTPIAIGKDIIIQSGSGVSYTIYQSGLGIRHFSINKYGKLTLQNVVLDGNGIGGGIKINSGGTTVMNSGAVIQNCLSNSRGGGILSDNGGELIINNGALIQSCSSSPDGEGGGIYTSGTVTINGGEILNSTGSYGGGIYASHFAVVNMYGGIISGNNSSSSGAGIFIGSNTSLAMYGGKVFGNSSTEIGGGVVVSDESLFTMYGGEITQNMSAQGGGVAMYNSGSWFVMKGGTISNNTATGNPYLDLEGLGGGLYLDWGAIAEIYAGTFHGNITNDSAGGHGGGIYTSSETYLTIYNSIITDNNASYQGGGIWVCNTGRGQANEFRGMAIYNNNVIMLRKGKDIHLNTRETTVTLSDTALGGGTIIWRNESDNSTNENLINMNGPINLTAEMSQSDIEKAMQYATVFIVGNTSAYRGGGLAINGTVTFGGTVPVDIDLDVKKSWYDESEAYRPDFVKVYLVIDGLTQIDRFVILDAVNGWKGSFKNLPYKDINKNIITYSVEEEVPNNYIVDYSMLKVNDEGNYEIVITNTFSETEIYTSKAVIKVWDDQNNKHNERPENVTVQLYANGVEYGESVVLDFLTNNWFYIWENLPKYYGMGGVEIVYTIKEIKIGDMIVSDDAAGGYTVSYDTDSVIDTVIITNILTSVDLIFRKIDANHTERWLLGAKFILYVCSNTNENHEHSKYIAGDPDYCWTELDTQISDESGILIFSNLQSGNYMLVEVEVPEGYQRPSGQWLIEVAVDGIISVSATGRVLDILTIKDYQGNVIEFVIPNEKNYELPLTGGNGQRWMLTVTGMGFICTGIFIQVFIMSKKRKA